MKIGLLECDHVAEHLRYIGGDYSDMFQQLFPGLELISFDLCKNQFPKSVQDCDAYIVTGSQYSVYDDIAWIKRLKGFVQEIHLHQKYYIGVCFGHQMLAEALGGRVRKSDVGWCVGAHRFKIIQQEDWMNPFQEEFCLLMSCQDQVQALPPNSTLLVNATDCPIGLFRVDQKMLGIQAHPEFPKEYSLSLMEARTDRIGKEKVEKGIHSLQSNLDAALFAKWMLSFLRMK